MHFNVAHQDTFNDDAGRLKYVIPCLVLDLQNKNNNELS